MVYAEILAGGQGTRMGNTDLPKQFLMLGDKPIMIHTIEQFFFHESIEKIVVCVSKEWLSYTKDIIEKYIPSKENIFVVEGGKTRAETLMNGCYYIQDNFGIKEEDIVVTHDAVTPFLTGKMISENIKLCKEYGATDTVLPAIETIVKSEDGKFVSEIPVRSKMYYGQNPQAFNLEKLIKLYESLTAEEKDILTDGCKIFVVKGEKVALVNGADYNMKITTSYHYKLANAIIEKGVIDDK